VTWRKSTSRGSQGDCVEAEDGVPGVIQVRGRTPGGLL
jgi:hypothetical protein